MMMVRAIAIAHVIAIVHAIAIVNAIAISALVSARHRGISAFVHTDPHALTYSTVLLRQCIEDAQ